MKKVKKVKKLKKKKDKQPQERVKYEKMQCKFIKKNSKQCKNFASGKSTLCVKHGGNPIIEKNLVPTSKISPVHLKLTKFDPALHPLQFIALSQQGMNKTQIAAHFKISSVTLSKWCQTYQEMNLASEIGENMNTAWWIDEGKANLDNNRYNTAMFKFMTGNTLGWSDKIDKKSKSTSYSNIFSC